MTKSNSILHRAAALLAALCLLASMALPVYAAETETEFSVSSSETIPGDDNTGNGADGTGSDISVSNVETIQKDADTTNEGSKTEPEISVPESGTITNSADTTDKAADAPPAEGVTGSENTAPADNAAADKTADADKTGEDSTGSEDEATFFNKDNAADDRTITAGNAKESDIALCAGDATVQKGTKYTFYFAPPDSWTGSLSESSTLTCSFKRGNNNSDPDGPKYGVRETTAKRTDDLTKDGRRIYQVDVYHNNDDADSLCPYGGFVWVKFTLDKDHWVQMNGARGNNNECWMSVTAIADKCLDGNKLAESSGGTTVSQEYDYDITKWVDYTSIIPKHVRYGRQTMTLLNNSDKALDKVTVTFWEKGDNGEFTQVGDSQPINTLQAGDHADITIPEAACAYVSFQKTDGTYIGKHYFNFYNDEAETKEIAVFPYDPVTRYCLIYKGDDDVRWSAPGSKTVYFDATFSDMSYKGDAATTYGMPDANGNLWCYMTSGENGKPAITSQMARDGNSEIWYADVPQGYTKIRFASWEVGGTNTANNGTDTALLTIPDLSKPCFYADTSDDVIYQGGNRGGYWDELGVVRDVEKGKKGENGEAKSIVDLQNKSFAPQPNTKYISTTLYDYYTDYELNGNNRNTYSSNEVNTQRSYVTFEQFDRALSNYYKQYADINNKPINYPLYTGHFQPNNWGSAFSGIASNLKLYGWSESGDDYWRFIAANNSAYALDNNHSDGHYKDTFQGLVGNQMVNGMPVMAGTTDLAEPHFNEAFLTGTNAEKAVLGKVYKDVSFPFTQKPVFTQNKGDSESKAQYWYFDSNERSLYLKQDTANSSKYYLEATQTGTSENPIYTDLNSQNRGSDNSTEDNKNNNQSRGYGFFPFNQKITEPNRNVNKYNYGFGAKLQFDFTLTDDGKVVVGTDENGKDIKVPIKFFFSGDDDVWVYIDGQLVLDVGGAHGKASGLLEFGSNGTDNIVTPYVSSNKAGGATYTTPANNKTVYFNGSPVTFTKQGKILDKDDQTKEFTLDKGTTHTLTMFYMERGMWESNMAVAFNFPDHNELQVEKEVDLSGVDEDFQACFSDQKIFDFTIQNLATHYGAKPAAQPGTGNVDKKVVDLTASGTSIHPATTGSTDYIFALESDPAPETNPGQVLHWFAPYNDLNSACRNMRYGILKLNNPIDLTQYGYLTFQIYVEGTTNLSLSNLYLELLDKNGKQMGSLGKAGLNGATFGSVTLVPNKWNTVKLSLNKMNAVDDFDNKVTTIRVGDNYQRDIYFRNFTFVPKTVPDIKTGFTTEQDKIPDYGSATTGALENATYAKYTSNFDGVQVVDDQGLFVLENGETITFNDQFRRGSYISLKEILDTKLYDTTWTVYENGLPVTSMKNDGVKTVTVADPTKSLAKQTATAAQPGPDDGRTEKKGTEESDNKYGGTKPTDANTIVFRSYSNPDESGDSLTRLKVQYINKVKTGGLIIKKKAAENENLTGTYEFKVTFSDVGGQGLETGDPIVKYYTIDMSAANPDPTVPITGIPVGTRYTIEEIGTSDGSHLQGVTLTGNKNNAHVVNTTVEGVIVESATPQIMTATFTNTKRTLIDIAFTKLWKDAADNALGSEKLPDKIYIQLQRRLENSTDWDAVAYPATGSTGSANYVIVTPTNGGWQCSFTGLDQHELNGNTNYVYRIVEGTVDTNDTFTAKGSSITIGGNTYTISAAATLTGKAGSAANGTITGGSGEIVLTNTLQDPKFTLKIVKKGVTTAENGSETQTLLSGVEFKLERLKESSGSGEPQVDTTYDFGSENIGSITGITGDDGQITDNPFKNLKPGSYQLTEVKTAEGYNLLSKPIRIEFDTKGECYIDGVKDSAHVTQAGNTYTMTLTVLNRKSFELPHTGADAPSLWLLIGLPALVAVLLVLVFRYNKKGGGRQ